jgi:G3E family GTPase
MRRIPLVLIAGFLGAGKTTFLRALMQRLKEVNLGFSVVVNDFENAEVDAQRLRVMDVEVKAIDGSCVCCSSLNEFMEALGTIDVPAGGVLLVEANGASDFYSLIAAISLRGECRRFSSPMQVTMIDAQRWQTRGQHDELEREQVRTSTHWVLTHTGQLEAGQLARVRSAVQQLAPRGVETEVDRLASILRFQAVAPGFDRGREQPPLFHEALQAVPSPHHHEAERAFTSVRVALPFVVERRELERTLLALPEEVVRVKGLCRLAELPQVAFSFQHVRPEAETWFLPMLGALGIIPTGVVIGVGLPAERIAAAFEALPSAELLPDLKVG